MFRYLFIIGLMVSPVIADPDDFPPTAFQLAQIRHYIDHRNEVEQNLFREGIRSLPLKPEGIDKFISDVSSSIASRLPANPLESDWRTYVQSLIDEISVRQSGSLLEVSFKEVGAIDLITRAIVTEQEALKEGRVILWRASQSTPEEEQNRREDYLSFSLGLFSGFLFDGYTYHLSPYSNVSSCTYTYYSSKAYANGLIRQGIQGVAERVTTALPEFFRTVLPQQYKDSFEIDEWPCASDPFWGKTKDRRIHIRRVTGIASEWYSKQEGYPRKRELERLYAEESIIFKDARGVESMAPLWKVSLFGVKVGRDEFNELREQVITHRRQGGLNTGWLKDQRGEFFPPSLAVYGAGELYHPKVKFPRNGTVIKLLDNANP